MIKLVRIGIFAKTSFPISKARQVISFLEHTNINVIINRMPLHSQVKSYLAIVHCFNALMNCFLKYFGLIFIRYFSIVFYFLLLYQVLISVLLHCLYKINFVGI